MPRSGPDLIQDRGCLAGCKVEEFNSPVWRITQIEKVDSVPCKPPAVPMEAFRLIQNAGLLTAIQWHLPYPRLFQFGVIKEPPVIGFNRIDATVSCYLDRRSTLKWYFPQLKGSLLVGGIEVKPTTIPRPIGRSVIGSGKSGHKSRPATRHFDNINLVIALGLKFKNNVTPVRRPTRSSSLAVHRCQLRAIRSVAITIPNIRI